ncbi:hypothetical protein ACEUKD_08810 [Vibrio diabolicus]|uniref:hypothetical protein n=1 Tax=Vibrio diabolicus TaxID=50719 RepID=UPI0035A8BE92|nr:hypothetical protein [Vibrio parahaemolyticus]EKH9203304.1 hypothetical protein [Vibrio parahaemolyticus]
MTDYSDLLLRIEQLESRVATLESGLSVIERTVAGFGGYKTRSKEELSLIGQQLSMLIDTVEAMLNKTISDDEAKRAKDLRRRLKNNLTRVKKASGE